MEYCESKTSMNSMSNNLTRIVGDLGLQVPWKNRDAGCTHKCVEDEMEEHEDVSLWMRQTAFQGPDNR